MVFQKPNPFPAMSIYENVMAGLKLTGIKLNRTEKDGLVEECLTKAGLWRRSATGCAAGRRPVRRAAAAAVHRPRAGRPAAGPADGRAVLGAGPYLHPA